MPKAKSSADRLNEQLRKMSGTDFALHVTKDLVVLPQEERSKALRLLNALNDTIARETAAVETK